jgi:phosphodiester glycosidase
MSERNRPALLRRSAALATSMALSVTLTSLAAPGASAKARSHSYQIVRGITLKTIRYPSEPNEVRVLILTPGRGVTVDVAAASPAFGGYQPVSQQASENGAIASINGDFSLDAAPVHWDQIDDELRTSGIHDGVQFAVSQDETRAWARHPDFSVTASSTRRGFSIDRWNAGLPAGGEIGAFTKTGGNVDAPGTDMCAARLSPTGSYGWSDADHSGVSRSYSVASQPEPCRFRRMPIGRIAGSVVLNARRSCACAQRVKDLKPGDPVTLTWKTVGWKGVLDAIGGQPLLVKDGKNVGPTSTAGPSYFYRNNPRTGVGVGNGCVDTDSNTTCKIFYVTVDGRQSSGWSRGMTLHRFADEFVRLGAAYAINLDGGGSTTMWVGRTDSAYCEARIDGGCVVNRPSGGRQRAVPGSLQVLPGDDSGEPPAFSRAPFNSTTSEPFRDPSWGMAALVDPGSTGGLLDALASSQDLPDAAPFHHGLRVYRRATGRPG